MINFVMGEGRTQEKNKRCLIIDECAVFLGKVKAEISIVVLIIFHMYFNIKFIYTSFLEMKILLLDTVKNNNHNIFQNVDRSKA